MSLLFWLGLFVSLALLVIGLTVLMNLLFSLRLTPAGTSPTTPLISILIPARNEAGVIAQTIRQLRGQQRANIELLLLDDGSSDGTVEQAQQAAAGDPRFQLLTGQLLPAGWLGKNWACHQLAQAAQGDILLFLDADVQTTPTAVAAIAHLMAGSQADLLTVWPTQQTVTWGERLVVPLMALAILGYLPILPVHYTPWPAFAAANGQCLAFRRAAYAAVGGHEAVREQVVEDVVLARRIKAQGLRLRMADGAGLVSCRMYHDWPAVRAGFAKNILAGHGRSVPFLALSTLFHWLVFIFPWVWWLAGGGWWPLALGAAGLAIRALTAAYTRQRVGDALLMPLSVLLMTWIAVQSVWWRWRGQGQWKGRAVPT